MALISCPQCGKSVSDRAVSCPHCGEPLQPTAAPSAPTPAVSVSASVPAHKRKIKPLLIVLVLAVLAALLGIWVFVVHPSLQNLSVSDITIRSWQLVESGSYLDTYTATVTSNETKPFIAVIGYYNDDDSSLSYVYMENGEGTWNSIYCSSDDDPSLERTPIGYLPCRTLTEKDLKSVDYKISDYGEYSGSTYCSADITLQMKKSFTGILVASISNDMNRTVDQLVIPIINGEGNATCYLSDLPYKSRGVKVSLTPLAYCVGTGIDKEDYVMSPPFTVKKDSDASSPRYTGEGTMIIHDVCKDGLLIYSRELTDGGDPDERHIVKNFAERVSNYRVKFSTFDWDCDVSPQYSFLMYAYLPFEKISDK